jgi:hypothetical protein
LAPTASRADLAPYSQDFEGLLETSADQPDQVALANDGWKGFVNVFGPGFYYNYGPFTAPNGGFGGPAISAVIAGEGGPEQGAQQLVIFSDYNNGNHRDGTGALIETNVFQEQWIGAADVGSTWRFEFDAKKGNIELSSEAAAFIKTLDPAAGFLTTNFLTASTTDLPDSWGTFNIDIYIDPSLEGQLLQFGFVNWASNSEGSGVFYDNVNFDLGPLAVALDLRPEGCPNPINAKSQGLFTAALLGTAAFDVSMVDTGSLALDGLAPVLVGEEDVATPFGGDLCGCTEAGPDGFMDLTLKFDTQELLDMIGPHRGYLVLTLTGTLLDGTAIEGQDCVIFVGGGGRQSTAGIERMSTKERRLPGDDASTGAVDLELR